MIINQINLDLTPANRPKHKFVNDLMGQEYKCICTWNICAWGRVRTDNNNKCNAMTRRVVYYRVIGNWSDHERVVFYFSWHVILCVGVAERPSVLKFTRRLNMTRSWSKHFAIRVPFKNLEKTSAKGQSWTLPINMVQNCPLPKYPLIKGISLRTKKLLIY